MHCERNDIAPKVVSGSGSTLSWIEVKQISCQSERVLNRIPLEQGKTNYFSMTIEPVTFAKGSSDRANVFHLSPFPQERMSCGKTCTVMPWLSVNEIPIAWHDSLLRYTILSVPPSVPRSNIFPCSQRTACT